MVYNNLLGIFNRHITGPLEIEDIPAVLGSGLLVGASLIAVIAILFYVLKKDLSKPEAYMTLRMILVFEIGYFLSFWPSLLVEGFPGGFHFTLVKVAEVTVPLLVESTLLPVVLAKLFFELNPNKPVSNQIKWGLISGTVYLFVFWLNNAGEWIGAIMTKGFAYITQYPINMLSFILTTFGLLLLALYAAYFSKKSFPKLGLSLSDSDLRKAGLIITALGTYLVLIFLLWLYFGSVGGWGNWYAWFLGHGYLDLWGLTLPFVGLTLLFTSSKNEAANKIQKKRYTLNIKQVNLILFLTQALGMAFYIILSAAYDIPLPSTKILIAEPIFRNLLTISGSLYFIFILLAIGLSINMNKKE
jgi:uncharacterized membrane protein